MPNKVILGVNDFKTYCLNNEKDILLKEWNYEINVKGPEEYGYGSSKKVWWICSLCGNKYEAAINHRKNGTDCPKCKYIKSKKTNIKNRKENKNTFGDLYPSYIKEWYSEKNGNLSPYDISPNYKKKIWWKCNKGHSWSALPGNRIKGRGCPYCTNRKILLGENDLATTHPELLYEWDYEKNDILPTELTAGSNKHIFWICKKNHQWNAPIGSRLKGSNCPYCGNKKIIVGENDLATSNPELVAEWNYDKNIIKPTDVVRGSGTKVWWKCKKGHEWQAKITNRIHGTGCPYCTMYMHTSFPEQAIFYYIKQIFPDVINRDVSLGFELDIYIPSINTGIEYDGHRWHKNIDKDLKKINLCIEKNIKLIKIREINCPKINNEKCIVLPILSNHDNDIEKTINELLNLLGSKKVIVNINKDRQKIYENYLDDLQDNSLAKKYSNIAKEWHPYKNGALTSNMVFAKTSKKIWWLCQRGHDYEASVISRTNGSGCPYCANKKILKGYNDLKSTNPELLFLWHPTKNNKITPESIGLHGKVKYWWLGNCGHEWLDFPLAISKNNTPCPYCGNRLLLPGFNDLKTINPELVIEWNYEKNDFKPDEVLAGTNKRVWWKCKECNYEWQAYIQNRREGARKNNGCPICADKKRKLTRINNIKNKGETLICKNPNLVLEWHPHKNNTLTPDMISSNSHEKVWWLGKCGHEWQAAISSRNNGCGCPLCAVKNRSKKTHKKVLNIDTEELFESVKEAAEKYGCSSGNIVQCCSGKTKTAKGYRWTYAKDN